LAACVVLLVTNTVCPSGAARATFDAAVWPLAPAMFSMTTVQPCAALSFWPSTRASVSVALPAVNGTTNLIARDGKSCAAADAGTRVDPASTHASAVCMSFIQVPPLSLPWGRLHACSLDNGPTATIG
jgi:hypothetical protein